MALADLLISDENEVNKVRDSLLRAMHAMADAALDYAKAALGAADNALSVVEDSGYCAEVYTNYTEIGKFTELTRRASQSVVDLILVVAMVSETDSNEANSAYVEHLTTMCRLGETAALLEATNTRLGIINKAIPTHPVPGARLTPLG
jgi:hypothetical protein